MFYFVLTVVISVIYGCEMDRKNLKTVLYSDGEMLNLTLTEGAYPDDIEVTKITDSCRTPMKVLPDQYLDDTFKKYDHMKQIRVPMTSAMHDCAYDVTMRSRSACVVKRLVRFEKQPQPALAHAASCDVEVALRWRDEVRAALAAERWFMCDAEHALCEERVSGGAPMVFNSEQIMANLGAGYARKIQINLRETEFAQNVSTFICQAASQSEHDRLTLAGRLVARAARAAPTDVLYRAGDAFHAACDAPHGHWVSVIDERPSVNNKNYTTVLRIEDDGMKLICVDIDCEAFESHQTCYKAILKEVRFRLKAGIGYGVIIGSVGASLVLAGAAAGAASAVRARRRRAALDIARRPRMPTPPPERPPHRQPYYSVPFERPIPGIRRD